MAATQLIIISEYNVLHIHIIGFQKIFSTSVIEHENFAFVLYLLYYLIKYIGG